MQQEEKAVFIFKKCSYEELQAIQHREDLLLSGWTLLEKEYMDVTEKVYGEVNLEASGEESESLWKQCGFESGCYLDRGSK